MIEQARATAQRLRDNWNTQNELYALSTIEALVAEAEQYLSDWKACTAMNRELLAEVERLRLDAARYQWLKENFGSTE